MKPSVIAGLVAALAAIHAGAQINAGEQKPETDLPFKMVQVTTLDLPWRIAFLPDGRMLITEKVGALWLVTQQGAKTPVANVPAVKTYTFPGPNLTPSETWSSGHRTPYGLAFAPDGRVGDRTWPAGRRRIKSDRTWEELRLAAGLVRGQLRWRADSQPGHAA